MRKPLPILGGHDPIHYAHAGTTPACIPPPQLPFSREVMQEIILRTCAISKVKEAAIRFWLGAGPGV